MTKWCQCRVRSSASQSAQFGVAGIFSNRFGWVGNQTPFYYLSVLLSLQPADPATTTIFVRLFSALAGAFTPLVVYGLGKEMFGRAQGIFAALLVALATIHLNYSQDARPYATLTFLTAASVYCLLRAERQSSRTWWIGFAVVSAINLLNAYVALTLFMPALAPYLVYLLCKLWSRRHSGYKPLLYALLSMIAVGLAGIPVLVDVIHMPRSSPDLHQFSALSAVNSAIELCTWFTQFGMPGQTEANVAHALFFLGLLGGLAAYFCGHRKSLLLCTLLIVVPAVVLAILSTTSVVFQRYALFALPFYYLLIANGVVSLYNSTFKREALARFAPVAKVVAISLSLLILVAFLIGTSTYLSANGHSTLSYRPDFRSASVYLSKHAKPVDTIIFVDDPALGTTSSGFYWRGTPPMNVYDARDPRLFVHTSSGDIYWVISTVEPELLAQIAGPQEGWAEIAQFEGVDILREAAPNDGILSRMNALVSKLEAIAPSYQPVKTLRGCVYQGYGDIADAARTYRSAGTYFPLGGEYLRSADGFALLGDVNDAWQNAFQSKFVQPQRPEVHTWLAAKLLASGYSDESRVETAIAQVLR